jgi:hypothetical protein
MKVIAVFMATLLGGCAYAACDSAPDPNACRARIVAQSQKALGESEAYFAAKSAAARAEAVPQPVQYTPPPPAPPPYCVLSNSRWNCCQSDARGNKVCRVQ